MRGPRLAYLDGSRERAPFDAEGFLLYFGGLVAALASAALLDALWDDHGAGLMFLFTALTLAFFAVLAAGALRSGRYVVGGLLTFVVVSLVPLLVYAFERWIDVWPSRDPGDVGLFHSTIQAGWVAMEIVTILAAVGALYLTRFPFLVAPLGFVLWYLSMDLAPLFFGEHPSNDERAWVSIGIAVLLMAGAALVEARGLRPYGFWGHLFGILALAGGLLWLWNDSDGGWIGIAAVSLAALLVGLLLHRPVYAVFCGFGLLGTAEHFIDKWAQGAPSPLALDTGGSSWPGALAFVLVALSLMALGLAAGVYGERWRRWVATRRSRAAGESPFA